ncbi:MAG: sigma-70 family RNA polymerase sigma factor [Patescibacteria group bacterium]
MIDCQNDVEEGLVEVGFNHGNIDEISYGKNKKATFLEDVSRVSIHFGSQCRHDVLSQSEMSQLFKRFEEGESGIVDALMGYNMRLVRSIVAKDYKWTKASYHDLVQEGCIGVLEAIKRFDYKRGVRFTTYASFWIHQKILRSLVVQEHTIILPIHIRQLRMEISRSEKYLENKNGRSVTIEEISDFLNVSLSRIKDAVYLYNTFTVSLDEVHGFKDDHREMTLYNVISSDNILGTEKLVEAKQYLEKSINMIDEIFCFVEKVFTQRQINVFYLYYDVTWRGGRFRNRTLQEVGDNFGVTREAIRITLKVMWKKIKARKNIDKDAFLVNFNRIHELEKLVMTKTSFFNY